MPPQALGFFVGAVTALVLLAVSVAILLFRPRRGSRIAEVRTRAIFGQLFLWAALGSAVLGFASGWPFPALAGIDDVGFRVIFGMALAFNVGFELWFWRPWMPRVQVLAAQTPCVPDSTEVRQLLEKLGFVLLGHKHERSRRATPCDVYAHEAERAWANLTTDSTRGLHGYFLSTFADGASVITWTCKEKASEGRVTCAWADGLEKAWEAPSGERLPADRHARRP
ncbi:MAG: hypothetical protein QM765_33060 [Myxococcales bacterium]